MENLTEKTLMSESLSREVYSTSYQISRMEHLAKIDNDVVVVSC